MSGAIHTMQVARLTDFTPLIPQGTDFSGWRTKGWKQAAIRYAEAHDLDVHELKEMLSEFRLIPDATSFSMVGPDEEFGYPVMLTTFLEVEISNPLPDGKRQEYSRAWFDFDSTAQFDMQLFVQGRYGEPARIDLGIEFYAFLGGET